MKYDTIREAAEAWVHEMNAIPRGMIERLMSNDPDDWHNATPIAIGDRVYCYAAQEYGEIVGADGDTYEIDLENGATIEVEEDDLERDEYGDMELPMWGTMWQFNDSSDEYWLTDLGGLQAMADCGFTVVESDEFGYFFGIDGAGYNFYEEHWIPLYKARGLHWHKEDGENED